MKKIFNITIMIVFLMVGIVSADINDGLVAYQPMEPQIENPERDFPYWIDPSVDEVDLGYNFTWDREIVTPDGSRNYSCMLDPQFGAEITVPDLSELAEYTISYSIFVMSLGGANLNVIIPQYGYYHIIVTKTQIDDDDSVGFRFYINNVEAPVFYFEGAIDVGVTFDWDGIQGRVDEIRVYDRVVGSLDRAAIYDHAMAGWTHDEPVDDEPMDDEPVDDEPVDEPVVNPEIEPLVGARSEPLDISDAGAELIDSAKDATCFISTLL
jgi:hypothetical protein